MPYRPTRITVDLLHYKQPWLDYCNAKGVSPSEAFRQVVAKLTTAEEGAAPTCHAPVPSSGKVRREIRLSANELRQVQAMAKHEGYSATRWMTAVVLARLTETPQLGQAELEALARSNMLVLAAGRNLNQLARIANASPASLDEDGKRALMQALDLIKLHTSDVAGVLSANMKRWRRK